MGRATPSSSPPKEIIDYAGIFAFKNTFLTDIPIVDSWSKISRLINQVPAQQSSELPGDGLEAGANGDYQVFFNTSAFSLGSPNITFEFIVFVSPSIGISISGATQTNPVTVTAVGHGLVNGDFAKIENVVGMTELNKRIFTVANVNGDDFDLQDDEGVSINGTGFGVYASGGDSFKSQITPVHTIHTYKAGGDAENQSAQNEVPLLIRDRVELFIKNITNATDILINSGNLCMTRLG